MTRRGAFALLALVAAASAAGGYAAHRWWLSPATDSADRRVRADMVFSARLGSLSGETQTLERLRGRVLVVNFWATWCAPCREEIPVFIRMQQRHGARGLQFVGIALDHAEAVSSFQREFGINYLILLGDLKTMELMRETGNRTGVLPYTLVIDREGRIAGSKIGGLDEDRLEAMVAPLL